MAKVIKFIDDVAKGTIAVMFYLMLVLVMAITSPYVYGKKVYKWLKERKQQSRKK